MFRKLLKEYKLVKYVYNSKTPALTDDKDTLVCDDVEYMDYLEKIIKEMENAHSIN